MYLIQKICCCGSGQHRSFAFQELMIEDAKGFNRKVTASFNVGVFDCMPRQISRFMSKVSKCTPLVGGVIKTF